MAGSAKLPAVKVIEVRCISDIDTTLSSWEVRFDAQSGEWIVYDAKNQLVVIHEKFLSKAMDFIGRVACAHDVPLKQK